MILFKRPKYGSLSKVQRDSMNGKIDNLLHRELVEEGVKDEGLLPGQPPNSIIIEVDEEIPSTIYLNGNPTKRSGGASKTLDTLYDAVLRIAKRNSITFEKVIDILYQQLPKAAERHQEQLRSVVTNPLYNYIRLELLVKDLATTPGALANVEAKLLEDARVKKINALSKSEEERQMDLLFVRAKKLLSQGFPVRVVANAIGVSEGMCERFDFRWKLDLERNK